MERPAAISPDSPHVWTPRTWTLCDGHAGNVRQVDALARALGVQVERDLRLQAAWPARALAPRVFPGAASALGSEFKAACSMPPALAIGCGRQGALATRLLRVRGMQAVQILDPRIDPSHWDLVIAPEHDRLRGDNVIALLGSLHPVDDAWLEAARTAFPEFAALPAPRTALLVGGHSRHARIDSAWLDATLTTLEAAMARDGGSLMIAASRRTDPALFPALRSASARWPGLYWLGPEDGTNVYAGVLAWAERIVCSPDSVNMLSEACATRVPVFVADPQRVSGRPRRFVEALLARGRVRALEDGLAPFPVDPLRETARVAAEVRKRLRL